MSKTFDKVKILRKQGLSLEEIAEETGLAFFTIRIYNQTVKKGYNSHLDYQNNLAKRRGFESTTEYKKYLVERMGFNSIAKYQKFLAKRRGFKSINEYEKYLAKKKGFDSITEYQNNLAKRRQKRVLNKKLSNTINKQLEKLDRNARWLAYKLKVTDGAVSRYRDGKTTPRESLQPKLFSVLKLPYKT